MTGIMVRCVDCGAEFEFTDREQQYYKDQGWGVPRRCKSCRAKRKPSTPVVPDMNEDETTIITAPAKFKVNCSTCGLETLVPFKPNPNRPVYCRACLSKAKASKRFFRR